MGKHAAKKSSTARIADAVSPFTGEFRHRLEQNRVMLPGKWRQASTVKEFVVSLWPLGAEDHLLVLPPSWWDKIAARFRETRLSDEAVAATERVLGSSIAFVKLDHVGRLALPEHLIIKAGISEEVLLVGRLDKFEIWNPARYAPVSTESRKMAAIVFKNLGI